MGRILLFTLLSFVSFNLSAQTFITDKNFESKISGRDKFSVEDQHSIVVVEFYADFNKDNAFKDWDKIKDVKYYRCNVADAPNAKKKYRVRTAPTIIIFVDGIKEETFKAGLDFLCPVELPELKEAIQQAQKSSQF